ncbi:zinc finger protein Helios isoform X2 [Clupea harengus]|uniref:Zinc finger protein Helios isoform X2 n=1 Tax=Clupea harengus TaxID=7950 RepID=A0A6P8EU42_CLUHA|nr:zinc finger protein Helios isoform X2 [Clupea harengus]
MRISCPMTMETETSDGYLDSNGNCSPRKENPRMLVDLPTSTPNGQHSQSPVSSTEHTIKQEGVGEEEEAERGVPGPDGMAQSGEEGSGLEDPIIDSPNNLQDMGNTTDGPNDTSAGLSNGDRPFSCSQCGVSFTQKGNLLRHVKLHTGEKPFKCPFCNYACRRRDALTGHLRTHSVGKPHKCNYCGRSYKQRTSLEEHKERCHNYLQSVGMDTSNAGQYPGDVSKEPRPKMEPSNIVSFERPPVIERLQGNVGKRKSTIPQKFVGEKMMRYSYQDINFDMGMKYEKEAELMQAHMMDQAMNAMPYLSSDSLRPMVHHPPLSMTEVGPMVNSLFHPVYPLGHRIDRSSNREPPPLPPPPPEFPPSTNGAISLVRAKNPQAGREGSPSNNGRESADSAQSSPRDRHAAQGNAGPRSRTSPGFAKGEEGRLREAALVRPGGREAVRVFNREGHELRAFQCEHCRVLFLDHVMFTIHMGCHGYRDPLECNICGHYSKDRYEFSSHIVRGEHTFH